jgi:hypothetical protein
MSLASFLWDCGHADPKSQQIADVLFAQRCGGELGALSCQDLAEERRDQQAQGLDPEKVPCLTAPPHPTSFAHLTASISKLSFLAP